MQRAAGRHRVLWVVGDATLAGCLLKLQLLELGSASVARSRLACPPWCLKQGPARLQTAQH